MTKRSAATTALNICFSGTCTHTDKQALKTLFDITWKRTIRGSGRHRNDVTAANSFRRAYASARQKDSIAPRFGILA